MNAALDWILDRAKERSTWLSILAGAATVFGMNFAPELKEAIATAGVAIAALVGVVTREEKKGK